MRTTIGWVAGSALLLLGPCLLSALSQSRTAEDDSGHVTGAFIAPLIFGGLIALGARWLYVRHMVGRGSVWSPWLTALALAPAMLVAVTSAQADREQERSEARAACSEPAPSARELTGGLTRGMRTRAAPPELLARAESVAGEIGEVKRVSARQVLVGDQAAAGVVVLETSVELDEEDVLEGFRERAGTELEEIPVGSRTGHIAQTPDAVVVTAMAGPCATVSIGAADAAVARRIAADLTL